MTYKIVHIDETASTNIWMKANGEGEMVVVADYQTAGRGCGTNTWESERGRNLLFSVLLHPVGVSAANQFMLSMANALALRDALSDYTDNVTIKWPNDIYWHDSKLCGTLIETTLQGQHIGDCIIGTGINVNQRRFLSDAPNPVSMYQILEHATDREEVLLKVLNNLEDYMRMVADGLWEPIRTNYRNHLYRLEETALYRFPDGREEQCKLVNVTDDGHIELLSADHGVYRLAFKEVQFVVKRNNEITI